MVFRIYVEKKEGFNFESKALKEELVSFLSIKKLENLRIINRYDVEGVTSSVFDEAVINVFSEPPVDNVYEDLPLEKGEIPIAIEFLPGQFDQRGASASDCISLINPDFKPIVKTAKIYVLKGDISNLQLDAIKKYLVNPVECRLAILDKPESLREEYEVPREVEVIRDFLELDDEGLSKFISEGNLAMDLADLKLCQEYFRSENRNPTITEIKVIDTYWSDHCRHTTFNTHLTKITFEDEEVEHEYQAYLKLREEIGRTKPITLMDMGTITAKVLKKRGLLDKLDESEEINACTVKIEAEFDGKKEPWLLLFKNETHNHPTEIEPFGGAATCIGGAIRDPLSGRSYVYSAMRITGSGDPLTSLEDTMAGKLPQRKITRTAAKGYSSYGNQIGLATGLVDELYHPGYMAKRMEVGAVVAAAPSENVRRERPSAGDVVILLGGRTGRDGMGGATGSSKSHNLSSLETCGAEVQKGNAPEERKLQRLFRNPKASRLIKRCNDFGAGGVSVAIGELADGLEINLNSIPKKYEGLDGTELAISESQERMAVVVAEDDAREFISLASSENLEATQVATVTEERILKLIWNGKVIASLSRDFLDTNGAMKEAEAIVEKSQAYENPISNNLREGSVDVTQGYKNLLSNLNVCSKKGLVEEFDSTIGSGTVLMPFGGMHQSTPIQAMANLVNDEKRVSDTCSIMSYGFNPYEMEASPFIGAYYSVVSSVAKLAATGASLADSYLSFQEYFQKMNGKTAWGRVTASLLGALRAQIDLEIPAIGGKDSMSGTFEELNVPPSLISFAITTDRADSIISPEFKNSNHNVIMLSPYKENGSELFIKESLVSTFKFIRQLISSGMVISAYALGTYGVAEAVYKMAIGNDLGFEFNDDIEPAELFTSKVGSFVLELKYGLGIRDVEGELDSLRMGLSTTKSSKLCKLVFLGRTRSERKFVCGTSIVSRSELDRSYEDKLENIFRTKLDATSDSSVAMWSNVSKAKNIKEQKQFPNILFGRKPKVLIPVFPGTNCEYDSARAFERAGGEGNIFIVKNQSEDDIKSSLKEFTKQLKDSQILFIPGGFSGGDEPEGAGKFITAFMRNEMVSNEIMNLLYKRDGLAAGICNGFQALIKLGLLPFGKIDSLSKDSPTLTFNQIGRHQSKLIRTKICSINSPWFNMIHVGDVFAVPISHGEGRFVASEDLTKKLMKNGQVMAQYVDLKGNPTMDVRYNPNGSIAAIECISSPDGRIIGKMAHSERIGKNLYKNVPGSFDMRLFKSAITYFK